MGTTEILFSILRSALCGNMLSDAEKGLITKELVPELMAIAQKHDLAHLVALSLMNNKICTQETHSQFFQIVYIATARYENLNFELTHVCEALETAKIPFIPLKGSVLRKYYPEPWMRTSCDIDILVREKDLKNAVSYLTDNLKYTEHRQTSHDVSLFSPSGIHVELHYDLVEDGWANSSQKILSNVWDYALAKEGQLYWYELPDSMFYFYHIAHMAKHLQQGGCGIRTFIDLWILDKIGKANVAERNELLAKGELLQFAETARKLSSVWMDGAPMDSVSLKMENYILRGGVYGTLENRIVVQQQKQGNKINYAFSKIFVPYDTLKFHYPILQKHRWLTPIMQVRRWFKLIFLGHAKRSLQELSYNKNVSESQADEMRIFLEEIGL